MSMTTKLQLIHRGSGAPGDAKELGPYQIETLLLPAEEGAATAYRVRIAPNKTTSVSYHKVAEEFYFVVAGHGTAILDGVSHPLKPGDFLRLPPGTTHGFVTEDEPLDMLDFHAPGCRPDHDVYFVGVAPPGFGAEPPSA